MSFFAPKNRPKTLHRWEITQQHIDSQDCFMWDEDLSAIPRHSYRMRKELHHYYEKSILWLCAYSGFVLLIFLYFWLGYRLQRLTTWNRMLSARGFSRSQFKIFSQTLQLHCKVQLLSWYVVCLSRECIVTKRLKVESRGFNGKVV